MRLIARRLGIAVWVFLVFLVLQPLSPWPSQAGSERDAADDEAVLETVSDLNDLPPQDPPSAGSLAPFPIAELVAAVGSSPTPPPVESATALPPGPLSTTATPGATPASVAPTPRSTPAAAASPSPASSVPAAAPPAPPPPPVPVETPPPPARATPQPTAIVAAAVPPPPPDTSLGGQFAAAVFVAVNAARNANGLPSFTVHASLRAASEQYARLLIQRGVIDHYLDGTPWERGQRAGYPSPLIGEILALYATSADLNPAAHATEIVTAWMNSPAHRDVIVSRDFHFTEAGVGCAIGSDALSRHVVICVGLAGEP